MTATDQPCWPAIDFYLEALDERLREARRTHDYRLEAEAKDEMRLARIELREMEAEGITRP